MRHCTSHHGCDTPLFPPDIGEVKRCCLLRLHSFRFNGVCHHRTSWLALVIVVILFLSLFHAPYVRIRWQLWFQKNLNDGIVFAHLSAFTITSPRMRCRLLRFAIGTGMDIFAWLIFTYHRINSDCSSNLARNSFRSRGGIIRRKCFIAIGQSSITRCINIDAVTVRTLANTHKLARIK